LLQHEKLNGAIVKIYNDFTKLVATTRNLDVNYVDSIAKGRVWTGIDGMNLGLVDQMGGLEDAIAFAAEKAELGDDYRLSEYPKRKEFIEQLIEEITGNMQTRIVANELGEYKTYYDQIHSLQKMQGIQARLPFFISIN